MSPLRVFARARLLVAAPGARIATGTLACALAACNVFDDELEKRVAPQMVEVEPLECRTHQECPEVDQSPQACVQPEGRCVPLRSEHCQTITGDLASPDALVLGSLFSTTGAQAATNLPRQQSAMLAVETINSFGGVPGKGATKRPLVLVSCDEVADLQSAAAHLINELKVPAIVGPNVSQDVIEVSNKFSVAGGTLLLSPTAVASSISNLDDENLTWVMVPSDEQRAPLMIQQINELEAALRVERRDRPIRLSIIHRNDALGTGTRVALNALQLNGKSLADNTPPNPVNVTIEPYMATGAQTSIVQRQLEFAPDIIVMAGLAEAITQIMDPLEKQWLGKARPYYVLIDSLKVPELLTLTSESDDLRQRVRGTGIVPTSDSAPVFDAFRLDYQTRWPGSPSTISGMGPAHDAAIAIAYALAATRDLPVTGANIAQGLGRLTGGIPLEVSSTKVLAAFQQLSSGRSIEAIGTFAPLQWDTRGAPLEARVEVWCVAKGTPTAAYQSSGLTVDLKNNRYYGTYGGCEAE